MTMHYTAVAPKRLQGLAGAVSDGPVTSDAAATGGARHPLVRHVVVPVRQRGRHLAVAKLLKRCGSDYSLSPIDRWGSYERRAIDANVGASG